MKLYITQWNFLGIVLALAYAIFGSRHMGFGALALLILPLAAALVVRHMPGASSFSLAVRLVSGALALFCFFNVARYFSYGIVTGNMAIIFMLGAVLPALNAIHLHPTRPHALSGA